MTAIWTVARRELLALFDQATAYLLLIVFVAVNDFLFFRQAQLYGVATLRPMFDLLPWVLLFLVPAVTMRAVAEDVRSGVIEVVLAQPITEAEFLLGKFVGQLLFVWIALALTLGIPLGLLLGSHPPLGVVVAQYVGAALLATGLVGVGVWASSVTRNQITAFILSVAVMFVLIFVGLDPLLVGLPPRLAAIAGSLGVLSHFTGISRGVIDLRDAIYFLSLSGVFLTLGYLALMRRKLTPHGAALRQLRVGTVLIVAGVVVLNLFGRRIGGRLDLTPGHAYTLSDGTRRILSNLNDLVTLRLFASAELPPEVAYLKRDVDDLLRDYRGAGRGKVRLVVQDPSADTAALRDARSFGIPAVQFNVVGRAELQVKEGYLGIAVQYAEGVKTIPFVRESNDLEYRLTSAIRALTRKDKPVVGLVTVGDRSASARNRTFQSMQEQLEQNYTVRTVTLPGDSATLKELRVLTIVGAPDTVTAPEVARLAAFLDSGGGILLMAGGMSLSAEAPFATARAVPWNDVLQPYGVSIRSDMVYDLQSNAQVSMPTQFGQVLLSYPLFVRAPSTKASPINAEVEAVLVPWASTIDTSKAAPHVVTPLLTTSRAAGVHETTMMLSPTQPFSRDSLARRLLAVQVDGGAATPARRGRLVVVGSADFAGDRYARNGEAGLVFVQNAVDWLAQDEALIAIRSKDRTPPPFVFSSSILRELVRYGNMIGIPLLLVAAGGLRLWRRRLLTHRAYRSASTPAAA
ncbi:MAG TPA: Gldg family protein [Gemmatimonadales bacterium]|nr:Gldg family protein [Gemmatimonadales bacterium]